LNALGQTLTSTDRNGTAHSFGYDVLGRMVYDAVTTLGSGIDGSVRRVGTEYDSQGHAYRITNYDATSRSESQMEQNKIRVIYLRSSF
jgi:YD repeat-containing protein